MIYDLSSDLEKKKAELYLNKLSNKDRLVELKEINSRSLSQNNYLHLIIGYFGHEFGYNMEESKVIYKMVNSDIFLYNKDGIDFYKSSSEITPQEMTLSIQNFRNYSNELGCYLPEPEDMMHLKAIKSELHNQKYLK